MEPSTPFVWEASPDRPALGHKIILYREGVRLGEWSLDEVKKLFSDGLLYLNDHYWRQGMKEWALLQSLLKPVNGPSQSVFRRSIF